MDQPYDPTRAAPRVPGLPDAPSADGGEGRQPLQVEFDGNASEYFGIWIVNILLTIITLGIYSPWAKVRRLRYFYGNTRLGPDNFDFLATGWQIFKGRLIVLGVLGAIWSTQFVNPIVYLVATLAIIPFVPWVINLALRFRANMTVWRNLRFHFEGNYWSALGVFVGMPLAGLFSFFLLMPLANQMAAKYIARNYRYGTEHFEAKPDVGIFYAAFIIAIGIMMAAGLTMLIPIGVIAVMAANIEKPGADFEWYMQHILQDMGIGLIGLIYLGIFAYLAGMVLASEVYLAMTRNAIINSLTLDGGHRFRSRLSGVRMAWIAVSNLVVTLLTIGLMQPWAAVRMWRYQASCYAALPGQPVDQFVAKEQEAVTAFGHEFADFEGFDIGIGI